MRKNEDQIQLINNCNRLLNKIKDYKRIAVFRHSRPDFDAIGCQMAMVYWLKDNFKDKEIIYTGEDHVTLTPRCFPKMMEVDDSWFKKPFLAIVLDTAAADRISDQRYSQATDIIKIDHHPQYKGDNDYGLFQIVDDNICAAGELLADILFYFESKKYKISKDTATYLFKAIVGDSNRFLNPEVNENTFKVAELLVQKKIEIQKIYDDMYTQEMRNLAFTKWVLDHHVITPKGVAYYFMEKEDLESLNVPAECGKECLYLFSHIDKVKIWMSVTWDEEKDCYRVSLRSGSINIEKVAIKWDGGGHPFACGAKLYKDQKLEDLVSDLDALL